MGLKVRDIFILVLFFFILSGFDLKSWLESKCGDGICQNFEKNRGTCPGDCNKNFVKKKVSVKTITENGGNVDWCRNTNKIAFDRLGTDKYFDVWLMDPDGSNQECITCGNVKLPNKHIGNPAWHPSGEYMVIQAEKPNNSKQYDRKAAPGAGILNDLYIISKDGSQVWNLYSVDNGISKDSQGVLHPHFSNNGKKLAWSQRIKNNNRAFGEWVIKIADFEMVADGPKLSNIRTLTFGTRSSFYETHTFSPDDSKLLFTGNQDGPLEIYELTLSTNQIKRLTFGRDNWEEHATYSPDGKKIIWMSSAGEKFTLKPFSLETDFWLMDSDGANKQQITFFNRKGSKDYFKLKDDDIAVAADNSWGPDGKRVVALIITADPETEDRDKGRIVMLEFE